jgi:murein DD-endopeptidase MepM/ murein hydrolase activator NlpD
VPAANGLLGIPIPGAVITGGFGPRSDPFTGAAGFHPGVDFGARYGVPIEAAADGIVVWAGPNAGYGNCTIIDHGHDLATLYAHQSNIIVKVGDLVTRGEVIGQVGSTGYSTGPHLHFEVRVNGTPVNPVPYL